MTSMHTFTTNWKRRTIQITLASVLSLGSILSFGTSIYAQGGEASKSASNTTIQLKDTTSAAQMEQWKKWMKTYAYSLDTIQPAVMKDGKFAKGSFTDLDMLKPLLMDKRIVYLGESSHGAAEFNTAKSRLIQFLHEELGFNVVAFETPMGNAATGYGNVKSKTPEQMMKSSVFPQWWAQETLPLFQYLKDTQATDKPLQLTGVDMQSMGAFLSGDWMGDEELAKRYIEMDKKLGSWLGSEDLAAYQQTKPELLKVYKDVKSKVSTREKQLIQQYPDNPHIVALVNRTLDDRIRVVETYLEMNINANIAVKNADYAPMLKAFEWRDQAMADNLLWLATEVYPTEKMIVWGHNSHISKAQSKIEQSFLPVKAMGERMHETLFGPYSYSLGLYMGSGQTADNTGNPIDVAALQPNSIEAVIKSANRPYTFVDMRHQLMVPGNSWMTQKRTGYYWGMYPETFVPRDQYDGILYIDKVKPSNYIE